MNPMYRKILSHMDNKLYNYIYIEKYSVLVPKATTIHELDRNIFLSPVLSVNSNSGYGMFGGGEDIGVDPDVTDMVDSMFVPYEDDLAEKDYGLNHKTSAMISIFEMAKLYDAGNFVYINNAESLRVIYGLLESVVRYDKDTNLMPNGNGGAKRDLDIIILDNLAKSIANIYKTADDELYFHRGIGDKSHNHVMYRPKGARSTDKQFNLGSGDSDGTVSITAERLKELGLD